MSVNDRKRTEKQKKIVCSIKKDIQILDTSNVSSFV